MIQAIKKRNFIVTFSSLSADILLDLRCCQSSLNIIFFFIAVKARRGTCHLNSCVSTSRDGAQRTP